MKQLLILIAALTLYAACKKEKITPHTTITGQVVSEYDGRPVPFATVFLITEERRCLGNMGCAKQVMTTQADADGKYSFAFDWVNDNFYSVDANGSEWYKHFMPTVSVYNKGKTNVVDVKMTPLGITAIRLKNVKHTSKRIRLSNTAQSFSGDNLDTTVYFNDLLRKNATYKVYCGITLLNSSDSVFNVSYPAPPPLDTATQTVEIFY